MNSKEFFFRLKIDTPENRTLPKGFQETRGVTTDDSLVVHVEEGQVVNAIPREDFLRTLHNCIQRPHQKTVDVLDESVRSLLKNRDFLALQLDLANENITEDEFEKILEEEGYLTEPRFQDEEEIAAKIRILLGALSCRITSPDIAMIFNCPITQADEAMIHATNNLFLDRELVNG